MTWDNKDPYGFVAYCLRDESITRVAVTVAMYKLLKETMPPFDAPLTIKGHVIHVYGSEADETPLEPWQRWAVIARFSTSAPRGCVAAYDPDGRCLRGDPHANYGD